MTAFTWVQAALTVAASVYVAVELRRAHQAEQLEDVQRREVTR